MPDHIRISTHNQTLHITLNRPKVLNALNRVLLEELATAIEQAEADQMVKGIIITGEGDKAFAAGADISEMTQLDQSQAVALSKNGQAVFDKIENATKPVIAAVNGYALGGGCELAMACHMRIAAENAKFGQPEVSLGLIAGYGGTQRLVRHIGQAKATELLITGESIDAQEALALRLVNYVTTQVELIDHCQLLLEKSYRHSPLAVALTLRAIRNGITHPDGFNQESILFGESLVSEDAREGTAAFLEKRRPNFTGK